MTTDYHAAATTTGDALSLLEENGDFGHARDTDPTWPAQAERAAVLALRRFHDALITPGSAQPPTGEGEYQVTWIIQIDADSPAHAARKALARQLRPDSEARFFDVTCFDRPTGTVEIDLTPQTTGTDPYTVLTQDDRARLLAALLTSGPKARVTALRRLDSYELHHLIGECQEAARPKDEAALLDSVRESLAALTPDNGLASATPVTHVRFTTSAREDGYAYSTCRVRLFHTDGAVSTVDLHDTAEALTDLSQLDDVGSCSTYTLDLAAGTADEDDAEDPDLLHP
ncbi:hypothetical protein OIE69_44445 (plasmid) [Actinacidiphila glaucinigra]|uniref:hypothetical protein n=1 Tax=Actinacidiphila glaucinigra TaxID=235986 RepID=UPI002DDBBD1A|nr:hypothetical protein [Actinacidiphila glaucinigra]WSD65756.1 hypothetical protein OIE69_43405 [Actinacidiphila glaucinigra]WSD65956.1 hypothetical protein OIE69_44445 [Actinacidiphila glaucinigra]